MKRHLLPLLYSLLLIALAPLGIACSDEEDPTPPAPEKCGRVVMVYMSMQNSLGYNGYHTNDSTEIANAMAYIPANDRLLLFIDDAKAPRIYELQRNLKAPRLVKRWTEDFSTASKEGLQQVLTLMRTQYNANEYALVLGSHATGWLPKPMDTAISSNQRRNSSANAPGLHKTIGIDVGDGGSMAADKGANGAVADQMEVADFARAVNAAGLHLHYILFDACLMQNVETDYALRNVADYIIGSPISISAEGAYYTDLVRYGLFSTPEMVAITYASYYKGQGSVPYHPESSSSFYGTVISCVRTDALPNLASAVRTALQTLTPTEDAAAKPMEWNMNGALNYHDYNRSNYYRPHFYDLYSAFKEMGCDQSTLKQLRTAIDQAVTFYSATKKFWIGPSYFDFQTMPDAEEYCGVSAFVPLQIYTDNAANCAHGDLNAAFRETEWYSAAGWSVTGW